MLLKLSACVVVLQIYSQQKPHAFVQFDYICIASKSHTLVQLYYICIPCSKSHALVKLYTIYVFPNKRHLFVLLYFICIPSKSHVHVWLYYICIPSKSHTLVTVVVVSAVLLSIFPTVKTMRLCSITYVFMVNATHLCSCITYV